MEQESSTTSSEALTPVEEEIASLRENLNWHAAILAVLLEEAGGAVVIHEDDLRAIELTTAQATISYDPEQKIYTVERVRPHVS